MAQILEFLKHKDDIVGYIFIKAMSKIDNAINQSQLFKNPLEVELKVNGIELPFVETLQFFNECYHEDIAEAVKKLVEQKVYDSLHNFEIEMNDIINVLKERFKIKQTEL